MMSSFHPDTDYFLHFTFPLDSIGICNKQNMCKIFALNTTKHCRDKFNTTFDNGEKMEGHMPIGIESII